MTDSCARCGESIASGAARFCASCGAPVPSGRGLDREVRKVVTVVFADISGSTVLGEQLDPEAVRSLLGRHFARARETLERHGGTVEKFIGDAVMAVFGIPLIHEDDALRAVRAAIELARRVEEINDDPAVPAKLAVRIGINTGEVVAGSRGETLVTGDAVNTAARLEQAASPGEIVMGASTYELIRDAVSADPMGPLDLRGKSSTVDAFRVRDLVGDTGHRRNLASRLVGRERELDRLREVWRSTRASESARLITILAPAGVGKSRLVREFGTVLGPEATVVAGRCLPYGDGITYWPIRELVHALSDIDEGEDRESAMAKLRALLPEGEAPEVARIVSSAIGIGSDPTRQEEIFWAVRRVFESAARRRPTAMVVEDLHWAEPTLLDLLEYVVEMSTQPLLIVATARPEVLTARPGWGRGATAQIIRLEPLADEVAEALLLAQAGAEALPAKLRARILAAAEGNALFVEEMIGMLRERGALRLVDGRWQATAEAIDVDVPATVKALLAARLDELPNHERLVAEHGSVMGRSFEAAALAAISPDELRADLGRRLLALVRKELLRPDRSLVSEGDAYRFRHILIRDAAYGMLPKIERAVLHERFADWLEQAASDRVGEFHEIIGYHLEQAIHYRHALAMPAAETNDLAQRAALALRAAGRAARSRNDLRATASLLRRSTRLAVERDAELGHDLRFLRNALRGLGELEEGARIAAEIDRLLESVPDLELRLRRELSIAADAHFRAVPGSHRELEEVAHRVIGEAEAADLPGLQATAMFQLGGVVLQAGRPMEEFRLLNEAEIVARRDRDPETMRVVRSTIANRLPFLPIPLDEAEGRLLSMLREPNVDAEQRGLILLSLAYLAAADDRADEARQRLLEARVLAEQMKFVMPLLTADWPAFVGRVELLAGDLRRAEVVLRASVERLITFDDHWHLADAVPLLARIVAMQPDRLDDGRIAEVERLVQLGRESALPDDRLTPAGGQQALALVASWQGDHESAVSLAHQAVEGTVPVGVPDYSAAAYLDLASVLVAAGRGAEATQAAEQARAVAASKKLKAHIRLADAFLATVRHT